MNNNAIHILRTRLNNGDNRVKNIVLSEGQPFFNITTNKLYVGDGNKKISKLKYIGEEVDQSLQSQISTETTNRTNADNKLQSQISAETTRAQNKESELQTAINSEFIRSTTFDNAHNNIENNNNGSILKNSNNNCNDYKSFLYGNCLTATANYQAIFGQYNNVSSTALLAVGGGTLDESKNLFEVSSTASKFNTKLKVSEAPKEAGDVLRWGDLKQKQVSDLNGQTDISGGDYLTGIKFEGDTLKFTKGSSTVQVTDNQTGSIVTNVTGNNGHIITLSRSNLSGGESAQDGYYISQVNPNGLDLQVKKEKIPDVNVNGPDKNGQFVSSISSNGHGITYSMGNIDGNLPNGGSAYYPIYIPDGSPQQCSFGVIVYDSDYKNPESSLIAIFL